MKCKVCLFPTERNPSREKLAVEDHVIFVMPRKAILIIAAAAKITILILLVAARDTIIIIAMTEAMKTTRRKTLDRSNIGDGS
jgi:hypothetical protein